ncbi:MAG: hypothetical protein N3E51_04140 [Candidatus Micrarchaeota archaeon]|nr:hypothetical protein [Candidatus Micrarchaeota archaeon]
MAQARASRTKDGVLLSGPLPQEFLCASCFEVVRLRDGSFLLTPQKEAKKPQAPQFDEAEKALLRKLLSIRFEKRIPAQVNRQLSREELKTLDRLMAKKAVQILWGGKYAKDGVYNLSEFAFHLVRQKETQPQTGEPPTAPPPAPLSALEQLEKFGWMVAESEEQARKLSAELAEQIRSGKIRGLRAFDRKFYFVSQRFREAWEKKVFAALSKGEKSAEQIGEEIGLSAEAARCLLLHLCESGELLEKRRGMFARA